MNLFKKDHSFEKQKKRKNLHTVNESQSEIHSAMKYAIPKGLPDNSFLRLPQVLSLIPVGKSTWWAGCKDGRFPKPVKLGQRTTAWRAGDIFALLEQFAQEEKGK